MKPNKSQLEAIEFLITQLKYWKGTNDISSPTHVGDTAEEIIKLEAIRTNDKANLHLKTNELYRLIAGMKEIEKPITYDMSKPTKITLIRECDGGNIGHLEDVTYQEIVDKVGGPPNATDLDDSDKVKASWSFKDNKGRKGYIYCYKFYGNPSRCKYWSLDGDASLLKELFGDKAHCK